MPVTCAPMQVESGVEEASFTFNTVVDPSALTSLAESQKRQLIAAATSLGLENYDSTEDDDALAYRPSDGYWGVSELDDDTDDESEEELEGEPEAVSPAKEAERFNLNGNGENNETSTTTSGAKINQQSADQSEKKVSRKWKQCESPSEICSS